MTAHNLAIAFLVLFAFNCLPGSSYTDPKAMVKLIDWKGPHVYASYLRGIAALLLACATLNFSLVYVLIFGAIFATTLIGIGVTQAIRMRL